MDALKRKEFFISQINEAIERLRGLDTKRELYLRWDGEDEFVWTRDLGATAYQMAEDYGQCDWDDIDIDNPAEVLDVVETVAMGFLWDTDDDLEGWFYDNLQDVCGVVKVYGYSINKAEALRKCDPTAWRELFLDWLYQGELDVSAYADMGE